MEAGGALELAIDVRQLASGVTEEQPPGQEVVRAAEIQEHEQHATPMCRPYLRKMAAL